MERLTFKQFLKEAEGIWGRFGTGSAVEQAYAKKGTFPYKSAIERVKMNKFYEGDPHEKEVLNIASTLAAKTLESKPRSRDYEDKVARNRAAASVPFIQKITEARFPFSKKVRVFDFDNTIANTNSSVVIRHKTTGEVLSKLSSADFARYSPKPHETPDFSEFGKVINPRAIPQIQSIMANLAKKKRPYIVLTARPQSSSRDIIRYLKNQGLHTRGVKVVGLGTSDPTAKARHLQGMLSTGRYTHLEFFDDHHENVKHVARLTKKFPDINIKARHIAKYGEAIQ